MKTAPRLFLAGLALGGCITSKPLTAEEQVAREACTDSTRLMGIIGDGKSEKICERAIIASGISNPELAAESVLAAWNQAGVSTAEGTAKAMLKFDIREGASYVSMTER